MKYMVCFLLIFKLSSATAEANTSFPDDFLIGFSTATIQIEGAWNEEGKGENIWDRLIHTNPDFIRDHTNADVACDSYHRYQDDIDMLIELGAQIYKFSLSWTRLLPTGEVNVVNQPGVDYYNKVIDALVANNIRPMINLYHWDLPQRLQELGGWANPVMIDYYTDYARLAFALFGDRVKYWATFIEPFEICQSGYGGVTKAPVLDHSGTADYMAGHILLLSHAKAYHIYDEEFRPSQKGIIGMGFSGGWNEPKTNRTEDIEAAYRENEFELGWFANPIFNGDYPAIMREVIDANSKAEGRPRSRLPTFTPEQVEYVKGTSDYYGLNHYTTYYAEPGNGNEGPIPSYNYDKNVFQSIDDAWPTSGSSWLRVVPWGFRKMLKFIKEQYNNPLIIVTENGVSDVDDGLEDDKRVSYCHDYLQEMLNAIYEDGCRVIGYTLWALMDNFEWAGGYYERFGIYYVDFTDPNRTRTPKKSARYFQEMIRTRQLPDVNSKEYLSSAKLQ